MQEIELKFQIPEEALQGVRDRLNLMPGVSRERLQARYFDTPDRRLSQARSALRLRKEGERWVQTLKAVGANTMIRLEDNQPVAAPPEGSAARIDLGRHLGGTVEASLAKALGWQPALDPTGERTGLVELYRTDIWRHSARLAIGQGTALQGVVELALDLGHIKAGDLSMPVQELEIELVEGSPMAVILAARDWVTQHALWLDTRTKAHRGDRLARAAVGGVAPVQHHRTSSGNQPELAGVLEQLTDAMSLVALGKEDVERATKDWRQALRQVSSMPSVTDAMPAVKRLTQLLDAPDSAPVELARAPSSTRLCLDLFAALLSTKA